MRARRMTHVPTVAKLAVGASALVFPATAVAFTSTGHRAGSGPDVVALHATRPAAVRYGQEATVRGTVSVTAANLPIELRYRSAGTRSWHTVARGRVHASGHFTLNARVARSGGLQVVATRGVSNATSLDTAVKSTQLLPSPVRHLVVQPTLALNTGAHPTPAIVGQSTQIGGHLLPGIPGRRVVLEVRHGHRWVVADAARTRRGGAFDFHYVSAATPGQLVQVAFKGDRLNGHAHSSAHPVTPMEYAAVSWYEDGGNTACGFHATYGIASRTLPCGSKVTLSYGGRSVVATVDDRGPFVYSRLYDLNQTTAGALGMSGLATVLASV